MKNFNYYQILELDENITDWTQIEKAIELKRRQWSSWKNQGTPAQKQKAEKYMPEINNMIACLKDPQQRELERKAFIKDKNEKRRMALDSLNDLLDIIHSSTITPEQLKLFEKEFSEDITNEELKKHIQKKGFTVDSGQGKSSSTKKKRLKPEASKMKQINEDLKVIGKKSLYDFLGANSNVSAQTLYSLADKLYKDLSATGKIDNLTTVKQRLSGDAKAMFKTEEEKRKYDNALEDENLSTLDSFLKIAGADKFLDENELKTLIIKAFCISV